jgi:uncharacterized membrane protein YvbJ
MGMGSEGIGRGLYLICSKCGHRNSLRNKFCSECGASLDDAKLERISSIRASSYYSYLLEEEDKGKRRGIMTRYIIAAILIFFFIIFILMMVRR